MEDFTRESDARRIMDKIAGDWIHRRSNEKAHDLEQQHKKENEEIRENEKKLYDSLRDLGLKNPFAK